MPIEPGAKAKPALGSITPCVPLLVLIAVFCLVMSLALAADTHVGNSVKGFKAPLEYFDPPHELQVKSYLEGSESEFLSNGMIGLRGAKLLTYHDDGSVEMIAMAPQCVYDTRQRTVSSTGQLQVQTLDSGLAVLHQGRGLSLAANQFRPDHFEPGQHRYHRHADQFIHTMRILFFICAAFGLSFILVAQTSVQTAPTQSPALVGTATNGQTIIHSHESRIYMKSNVYVWGGAVRVDNPQMQLSCELLTVEAPKLDKNKGKYNRATAETNVVIIWTDDKGTNEATADRAVYTYTLTNTAAAPPEIWETNAFVILTGNPAVSNAQQGVYRADPIIWDRIRDIIYTTNFHEGIFYQNDTNSPGLFDTKMPKEKPAAK
jgi:lipopolysaccharide export system protein LptA